MLNDILNGVNVNEFSAGNSPGFVGDVACIAELPVAATTKPSCNIKPLPQFLI